MKKIFKLFVFLIICLLPVMVDAKTELKYEWKLDDKYFIIDSDGEYYFRDLDETKFFVYDKNGSKVDELTIDYDNLRVEDFYKDKVLKYLVERGETQLKYNSKDNKYFFTFYDETDSYLNLLNDTQSSIDVKFSDDIDLVKEYLGVEYTVYKKITDEGCFVYMIYEQNNHYITYFADENSDVYVRVYDNKANKIFEYKVNDYYYVLARVVDNKIYLIEDEHILKIYDLTGKLLESFDILNQLTSLYNNHDFYLMDFQISNNNVMFFFDHDVHYDSSSTNYASVKDYYNEIFSNIVKGRAPSYLFLKYRLTNDIELKDSTNGGFSVEKKIDEYDREIVVLNITPDNGYMIDKIIVTDSNGNNIEVKDNKFIMPVADVKVDVQFKQGEYVPIPDTFSGLSTFAIIFGIILLICGSYLMLVMIESKKVEE